jgi:hypothetical protein
VALKAQGDDAQNGRNAAGHDDGEREPEPGRISIQRRHPRRGVGGDTDKRRLPKGYDSADARQQRQSDRNQRVNANVVQQRGAERAEDVRCRSEAQDRRRGGEANLQARHSSISSSECSAARDRQTRIGINRENTITSFRALL